MAGASIRPTSRTSTYLYDRLRSSPLGGRHVAPCPLCGQGAGCCIVGAASLELSTLLSYPTSPRMLGNISSLEELEWRGRYPTCRMGCWI